MEDSELALDAGIDGGDVVIYEPIDRERIRGQILEVRGVRVMLDRDIAEYFGVETKALNRAMKRNIKRFPEEFCFQLTREEYREILRCQSGTLELEQGKYSKYPPYVYTERGGYADFGIAHVLLIDSWSDQEAIDVHHASPMMKQLSELRDKYDLHMTVERFVSEEYESDDSSAFVMKQRRKSCGIIE